MADTIVLLLPETVEAGQRELHWWSIADGAVTQSGADAAWLDLAAAGAPLIGLAPTAAVRLAFNEGSEGAATSRQAAAVARLSALERSLGDTQALHAVSAPVAKGSSQVLTAVVDNGAMLAWLQWAEAEKVTLDRIVPVASLISLLDGWVSAAIGSDHVVGRWGMVLPNEPELAATLVGPESVRELSPAETAAAIASAPASPLNLRTGRFAKRGRLRIDRSRIRELLVLAALIPIISLLWAIFSIVQLNRSTDRLDAETLQIAEGALGRPAELEAAEAELRARAGAGAVGGFAAPLSALYQGLQSEESVSSTQIAYASDGTLSTTLAAPTVDAINRLLLGLQRSGHRVTAVPRQAPDGRAMVDLTVRSGP
ncbi:MAG: type II secretion system protein GspL [Pseudomonadota bacterium]|nr:type II secretion system protein GspL [Pseudomonadota bacterium]